MSVSSNIMKGVHAQCRSGHALLDTVSTVHSTQVQCGDGDFPLLAGRSGSLDTDVLGKRAMTYVLFMLLKA